MVGICPLCGTCREKPYESQCVLSQGFLRRFASLILIVACSSMATGRSCRHTTPSHTTLAPPKKTSKLPAVSCPQTLTSCSSNQVLSSTSTVWDPAPSPTFGSAGSTSYQLLGLPFTSCWIYHLAHWWKAVMAPCHISLPSPSWPWSKNIFLHQNLSEAAMMLGRV